MLRVNGGGSRLLLAVFTLFAAGATTHDVIGQQLGTRVPVKPGTYSTQPAEAELFWPLPESAKQYGSIDGRRMKAYVNEIVAIAHRHRDAGNQYWGRIVGTSGMAEAEAWMTEKLKALVPMGLELRRSEEFEVPPQWMPTTWSVSAVGGDKAVKLVSAWPVRNSPASKLDLEAVWVGMGSALDVAGKDLKGKAAVIYSAPTPGVFFHSAASNGANPRVEQMGAAAVIVVLALPGNVVAYPIGGVTGSVPAFMLGLQDGNTIQTLLTEAPGRPVRITIDLATTTLSGLKSSNIIGMLPGETDENVLILTHLDSFFEGGNDNASGMATFLGLAEYFAKMPRKQRRRNIYFLVAPAHHSNSIGGRWMHDNMQPVFAKTAINILCEHTAVSQPYYVAGPRPAAGSGIATSPVLGKSNAVGARWFAVNGSDRLASVVTRAFALFGVQTYLQPIPTPAGELVVMQTDSPSLNFIDAPVYFHTDHDTADVVPAAGLESVTRAFAKIVDDVNRMDLKDVQGVARTGTN